VNVFILGGKGFVGSAMVREAKRRGHSVQIIDVDEYKLFVGHHCDLFINANGNSKKFLADEDPNREFELSFTSVKRSIQDFPCDHYVLCSTADVYTDTSDPGNNREDAAIDICKQSNYGFHKYMAEQYLRHYHPRWMICRFGGFVGHGIVKNPIFDILNGRNLWVSPQSRMQYLNTDKAAETVFSLVEQEQFGEIFNIGGTGTVKLSDVIEWAGKEHTFSTVKENVPVIEYRINTDKVNLYHSIPSSADMVREFVANWPESGKAL